MGEMQSKSDAQLIREYAEHGGESAFSEIVTRHTNLVYSAAMRQTDSPDLAAEATQSVFIGLARGARALSLRLAETPVFLLNRVALWGKRIARRGNWICAFLPAVNRDVLRSDP